MSESKPIPTRASKERIHAFAEEIAKKLSFGPGDDIEMLVKRLGGKIHIKDPINFSGEYPESIIIRSATDFTIFVPSMTSPERDRFTIAHELGHLALHYPLFLQKYPGTPMIATRWVDETDQIQQRAEWEANWFAAGFLMGGKAFKEAFIECRKSLSLVASKFGVSAAAAEIRAKNLSLI
ncbi:ImmA/IrrE family metallo-endopeptidase [Rhizobium sp. BK538]|uniref:ImmA/IrrE family metallo-endopeptidase n=1 Tax=Rhizobium sp. BK538 TaxID=2586984 RepID=UPI00160DBF87|nr:ImmA/IrrE family metallo-endopeptidase [Rhizobium sp. BK538]MBB4168519.1 putative transcriptional regulator [Rhizobium sp. BK538]